MKKLAAGCLAGAVLMISTQAIGASTSLVGKTIQAEYTVNVYGKKLADKAIVIDGKSYAPVRAIGELAGYKVSLSGKTISLDEKEIISSSSLAKAESITIGPLPTMTPDSAVAVTKSKIKAIDSQIDNVVDNILSTSSKLKLDPSNTELKDKLEEYKAEYGDLLKQKDAELQK
ncbi:hypothetical protein A3844_02970 [Paenibacillus helianthi]|uniref:Copper amine oxidase-like N-terminal domain-containing protein n=1 Tax=Paenibacillus helianthi TaxID=1349432 RepID=A0ABX3ESH9_9BACL|nr:hypothetical protein [Paenibacillus helianthi]OKP90837.1 hypothetical protein A3844_02970 [Paenibacillus helianthi]